MNGLGQSHLGSIQTGQMATSAKALIAPDGVREDPWSHTEVFSRHVVKIDTTTRNRNLRQFAGVTAVPILNKGEFGQYWLPWPPSWG